MMERGSFILAILYLPFHILVETFYFIFQCRPQKRITDEHILITGAAQGIGAEFARQFAELGNTVHCVDVNKALIEEKVDELTSNGHKALAYTCNLTDVEQVKKLHEEISLTEYPITVLVNNAGVAFGMDLTEMSLTQIEHTVKVNLISNLWLINLFLPKMMAINKGRIVNVASMAGFIPLYNSTDYCATKAASIHTMNQLRLQTAGFNVKYTAVCPCFVQTQMMLGVDPKRTGAILPEDFVGTALKGIRQDKEIVVVPIVYSIVHFLLWMTPNYIRDVLFIKFKEMIEKSMDAKAYIGQRMTEKIK